MSDDVKRLYASPFVCSYSHINNFIWKIMMNLVLNIEQYVLLPIPVNSNIYNLHHPSILYPYFKLLLWLQPLLLHSTYIHSCILFHKEHKIHLIHNEVNLSILMLQHIFQTTYSFFLVQKMPMIQSGQVLLRFLLHHDYYS